MSLLHGDYQALETEQPVSSIGALSWHLTRRGAERAAAKYNARRVVASYACRAVRKGRWRWEVIAFQNVAIDLAAVNGSARGVRERPAASRRAAR